MRRVTIAVIGNGKTTRANLEALITDTADAMDKIAIATVYDKAQSQGQTWAEQLAADKGWPWAAYDQNDYKTLFKDNAKDEVKFFVLWDDDDPDCQQAAYMSQEYGVLAYDLTNGLMKLGLNTKPIEAVTTPDIPEVENTVSAEPVEAQLSAPASEIRVSVVSPEDILSKVLEMAEDAEDDEEDPEDDDDDDVWDLGELLENAIEEAARHFARSFASEFKKIMSKDEQ